MRTLFYWRRTTGRVSPATKRGTVIDSTATGMNIVTARSRPDPESLDSNRHTDPASR